MKLNDLNISEIISLCKSEIAKLSTSKETCIKLYELIQELKESEEVSEMEQPRKFLFVSDRDQIKPQHPELTLCNPELIMNLLNQESQLFLYNSESESNESCRSMKRSQAKINLLNEPECDSVISTAEEHQITCIKVDSDLRKLKPKSTSSTTSLLPKKIEKLEKSMSFNVEVSSTPKKVFQRSSTIRRAIRKQPLTSTMIKPEVKKMRIPPPLLSSSIAQDVKEVKVIKRKRSSSMKKNDKKMKKVCSKCSSCRNKYDNKSSDLPLNLKNLKYPIKFCPNLKSKDIDRINVLDTLSSMGYENNLKPTNNNNCYGYGDVNVWFL
ncbi:unnamed protein product [Brachionus calyciflorus]|uniref:Uncharacterized protein n=1 Tax=Brachionus calyciflorus TaxID=104777 RepID=A0A813N1P2_9BILA|nr:unnamed protein product [Brachionus calyciflorus]